jgi:hypothetical protein
MNKNISKNSDFLKRLDRKATGEAKTQIDKVIELSNARKVSQVETAENVISKLINKDQKYKHLVSSRLRKSLKNIKTKRH